MIRFGIVGGKARGIFQYGKKGSYSHSIIDTCPRAVSEVLYKRAPKEARRKEGGRENGAAAARARGIGDGGSGESAGGGGCERKGEVCCGESHGREGEKVQGCDR